MAKPPNPSAVQDMKGAYKLHPERRNPDEPKSDMPLGPAPAYLTKEEKAVWRELTKQLIPGVALHSDRLAFEALVRVASKMRNNFEKFTNANMSALISLCARFALTPSDRTKVSVSKPKTSAISKYLSPRRPAPPPAAEVLPDGQTVDNLLASMN
jgi:phage terminase small subunit